MNGFWTEPDLATFEMKQRFLGQAPNGFSVIIS
jgi:hypothetical protein